MAIIVGVSIRQFGNEKHEIAVRDVNTDKSNVLRQSDYERLNIVSLASFVAQVALREHAAAVHVVGGGLATGFCDLLQTITPTKVVRIERYSEAVAATYWPAPD